MTHMDVKHTRSVDAIPADDLDREMDDRLAALPPATDEALEAALDLIGDEIARREVLASRADDETASQRLMAALWALHFVRGAIDDDVLLNDFLRDAEQLREELADLPAPDPGDDDAWVLREE